MTKIRLVGHLFHEMQNIVLKIKLKNVSQSCQSSRTLILIRLKYYLTSYLNNFSGTDPLTIHRNDFSFFSRRSTTHHSTQEFYATLFPWCKLWTCKSKCRRRSGARTGRLSFTGRGGNIQPRLPERCEAAGSAACLLSSVKLTGCNPPVMGVFVLAVWTGSHSPNYTLTSSTQSYTVYKLLAVSWGRSAWRRRCSVGTPDFGQIWGVRGKNVIVWFSGSQTCQTAGSQRCHLWNHAHPSWLTPPESVFSWF